MKQTIDDTINKKTDIEKIEYLWKLARGKLPMTQITIQYYDMARMLYREEQDSKVSYENVKEGVFQHLKGVYLRDYHSAKTPRSCPPLGDYKK